MAGVTPDPWGRQFDQAKVAKAFRSGRPAGHRESSEYGGVEGLIQPAPHDPTELTSDSDEMLMMVYSTDPGDELSSTEFPELPLVRKYTD